jgi:hypothetical protein
MIKRLLLCLLVSLIFVSPIHAIRSLPPDVQPESMEGEAKGIIPELHGSGTLTFTNVGGDARLVTTCDTSQMQGINSVTCEGIDVTGTFTGGPYGVAVFKTGGGEVRLQLADGKVFSYSAMGLTMNFTVTDPSIFDAWVENAGARDSGARVSDLSGQVEIACPPDLETWDVMKMGRIIYVDCHLKTGEDSNAIISFSDMTTFEMKPESEIVIDTPAEKESKISLLAGNIWANVKQMVKDGTMKIHMSQAVAGIKGTRFILSENGSESTIQVTEGTVNFTSISTGASLDVNAGESVIASSKGLSKKTIINQKQQEEKINTSTPFPESKIDTTAWNNKITYALGTGIGLILATIICIIILRNKKPVQK